MFADNDPYWVPIDADDLRQVAEIVRDAAAFTPTFVISGVDYYDPVVYLREARYLETSTRLVVDRNLLTRWVGIVRGESVSAAHRVAAAVLTFAQCANIDIEPNIPLYEVARRLGAEKAHEELRAFRIADRIHPRHWAAIALGQANSVPVPRSIDVPSTDFGIDFAMWLRRWRRHYIVNLKLAQLELQGGRAADRMSSMLGWMHRDFLMSAPGLVLAAKYLAPNSARKRLLKGLRSADRELAIEGVRNATWDLALLNEWSDAIARQQPGNCLTLLASLDQTVHFIARSITDITGGSEPAENLMKGLFVSLWGDRDGTRLSSELQIYYSQAGDPSRQVNKPMPDGFIDTCIDAGESILREWSPTR